KKALEKIWVIMDYICGKRLAPFLPEIISKLESFKEIEFPLSVKEKLMRISASSIDRLLKDAKRKLGRKGSSYCLIIDSIYRNKTLNLSLAFLKN
ncbi:hypothetical protein CH372_20060, partial [Leptospira meyeri]